MWCSIVNWVWWVVVVWWLVEGWVMLVCLSSWWFLWLCLLVLVCWCRSWCMLWWISMLILLVGKVCMWWLVNCWLLVLWRNWVCLCRMLGWSCLLWRGRLRFRFMWIMLKWLCRSCCCWFLWLRRFRYWCSRKFCWCWVVCIFGLKGVILRFMCWERLILRVCSMCLVVLCGWMWFILCLRICWCVGWCWILWFCCLWFVLFWLVCCISFMWMGCWLSKGCLIRLGSCWLIIRLLCRSICWRWWMGWSMRFWCWVSIGMLRMGNLWIRGFSFLRVCLMMKLCLIGLFIDNSIMICLIFFWMYSLW